MPENPPAFPAVCLGDPGHPASEPGMSLRDWFAGQFLTMNPVHVEGGELTSDAEARYARDAYDIADLLLAERERRS